MPRHYPEKHSICCDLPAITFLSTLMFNSYVNVNIFILFFVFPFSYIFTILRISSRTQHTHTPAYVPKYTITIYFLSRIQRTNFQHDRGEEMSPKWRYLSYHAYNCACWYVYMCIEIHLIATSDIFARHFYTNEIFQLSIASIRFQHTIYILYNVFLFFIDVCYVVCVRFSSVISERK